ncbi:MAG: hypothetical protein JXR05_13565 [Flavobacteriaceae bacterium]
MKKVSKILFLFACVIFVSIQNIKAQSSIDDLVENTSWFISLDYGVQMSGIKSEDFVSSNYSPVHRFSIGKWISPSIAVNVGYQGRYFRAISDNYKYSYDFYFIEGVLSVGHIFSKDKKQRFYDLLLHAGPGYFNHHRYGRSRIHGNLGAANVFSISKKTKLKLDISAIVGWDIYQGDNDILPNMSFGIFYSL